MKARSLVFFAALILAACSHGGGKTGTPSDVATHTHTDTVAGQPARPSACKAAEGLPAPKNFADLDFQKDGTVSRDEFLCQITKTFRPLDKDRDFRLNAKETGKTRWLKIADTDANKFVTIVEYLHAADATFQLGDQDKSSSLTAAEFAVAFPDFK